VRFAFIREQAANLLDPSLRGHRLAAVAYDETGMASDAKERAWTLLLDEAPRATAGLPRTLLVVVSAPELDYDRHCRAGAGARWALLRGSVWWRRRAQSDVSSVAELLAVLPAEATPIATAAPAQLAELYRDAYGFSSYHAEHPQLLERRPALGHGRRRDPVEEAPARRSPRAGSRGTRGRSIASCPPSPRTYGRRVERGAPGPRAPT